MNAPYYRAQAEVSEYFW